MRYSGYNCESCKKLFKEDDDVVVCPQCGAPHHRECWNKEGKCAKEDEHANGYLWKFAGYDETYEGAVSMGEDDEPEETDKQDGVFVFKNGEKAVECKNCGALNYGNDAFCMRCHAPLNNNNDNNQNFNYENDFNRKNAYEYNYRFGGLSPETPVFGIPALEYSDYIGGNNPGKTIRRFATMERFGRKIIPNLWALIFGPIWFFYKKMYKTGAILLAAFAALSIVSGVLYITEPYIELNKNVLALMEDVMSGELSVGDYSASVNALQKKFSEETEFSDTDILKMTISTVLDYVSYALRLICMLFANYWYRKKVHADILAVRKKSSSMLEYRDNLAKKGGNSVIGVVISIVLFAAASLLSELPLFIALFR